MEEFSWEEIVKAVQENGLIFDYFQKIDNDLLEKLAIEYLNENTPEVPENILYF